MKYIVYGEKEVRFEHESSYVIINVVFNTREEAEAGLEERRFSYKKLQIIEEDTENKT